MILKRILEMLTLIFSKITHTNFSQIGQDQFRQIFSDLSDKTGFHFCDQKHLIMLNFYK